MVCVHSCASSSNKLSDFAVTINEMLLGEGTTHLYVGRPVLKRLPSLKEAAKEGFRGFGICVLSNSGVPFRRLLFATLVFIFSNFCLHDDFGFCRSIRVFEPKVYLVDARTGMGHKMGSQRSVTISSS